LSEICLRLSVRLDFVGLDLARFYIIKLYCLIQVDIRILVAAHIMVDIFFKFDKDLHWTFICT